MATSTDFEISTEAIPPRDERDAAIKSLEDKCRSICNLAHEVREAERALHAAEAGDDRQRLIEAAMTFGGLRERIYNLKDEIERDLRHYNLDRNFGIAIAHTADGLPVHVSKARKVPLWGI